MLSGIRSGEPWFDTAGSRIDAHGGGFLLDSGLYHWFGSARTGHACRPECKDGGVNLSTRFIVAITPYARLSPLRDDPSGNSPDQRRPTEAVRPLSAHPVSRVLAEARAGRLRGLRLARFLLDAHLVGQRARLLAADLSLYLGRRGPLLLSHGLQRLTLGAPPRVGLQLERRLRLLRPL